MMQLGLFDARAKARRSDPETSKEAAERSGELARRHHRLILDYLECTYPRLATYEDIAAGIGLDKHAVGRRLKELEHAGQIECAGATYLSTGRPGRLWARKR